MARLPYLERGDLPEEHQSLLDRDINLNKLLAHSPHGAESFSRMGGWIRFKSRLDPRLRELAILQVGWLARSPYEWSHHVKLGREFGCSDDDIRAVGTETDGGDSGLPALDRAVLRAAREMTTDISISDVTWAELGEELDAELITDLTLVIGFYNMVVRYLGTMEMDVEEDYQPYLEEHPLPG
ncbi:MAG: carboxymuconolactone decarboxylase family protein [Actinomycetia bacterium]|nr:carboxymuconolactone decarboxylase family protein [Actinomycetes bacterium]MCP3912938.1 carboxymuconolactone decarboxylase family protein [Actinomycetes bacterium]MCP4086271.1 carboxymuconolactone decarboxylase family protein [Actinomycetes bacterium]